MRTLKKTLALVLVLAMVLGLGVTANAAFTDADEIENTLEVDTMVALGVLEGMPDGSYDPAGSLTRAQGATMIVRLLGLDEYVDKCATPFTDVPATHWASGYIAYCAEEGILDGYGDGNFGPSDLLTGYQWAKMIVAASEINFIKYDSEGNAVYDELTGSAWQIKTAKYATQLKLWTGDDSVKTEPITRDVAALVGFNFLTETLANTYDKDGKVDGTYQYFMEQYFGLQLEESKTYTTAYGAPDTMMVLTGGKTPVEVGVYAAEPVLTYTTKVTGAKLLKDLKAMKSDSITFTLVEDSKPGTAPTFNADLFDSTDAIQGSGNGVLVEVYDVTPSNAAKGVYKYDIVVINTYAAEITGKMITEEVAATATTAAVPAYVTIDGLDYVTDEFIAGEKLDDVVATVLYTKGQVWDAETEKYVDGIVTLKAIEPASGKVTAIAGDNTYFKVGDTKYELAENQIAKKVTFVNDGFSYDVYTDAYGYVVKSEKTPDAENTAAVNYGYLLTYQTSDYKASEDLIGGTGATVAAEKFELVNAEGKKVVLDGDFELNTDGTVKTYVGEDAKFESDKTKNLLVAYTLNADGEIDSIAAATADTKDAVYNFTKGTAVLADVEETPDDVDGNADQYLLTADTMFIYKTSTGYATYVGYQNAPTFKGKDVQFIVADGGSKLAAVYVNGTAEDIKSDDELIAYIFDTNAVITKDAKGNSLYTYTGYEGTKEVTLTFSKDITAKIAKAGLYVYTLDDGIATLQNKEAAVDVIGTTGAKITAAESTYFMAGEIYYTNANTAVYVIDADAKTITAGAIELSETTTVTAIYALDTGAANSDSTVDVVYITVADKK